MNSFLFNVGLILLCSIRSVCLYIPNGMLSVLKLKFLPPSVVCIAFDSLATHCMKSFTRMEI